MGRARLIHPEFAQHELLGELPHSARLLFALLPTIVDRDGRTEDRPRRIKANLFPYDTDEQAPVEQLLVLLADAGFIRRYEVNGVKVLWVPGFRNWQKPHPREAASELPPPPDAPPETPAKGKTRSALGAPRWPVSDPVSDPVGGTQPGEGVPTPAATPATSAPPSPAAVQEQPAAAIGHPWPPERLDHVRALLGKTGLEPDWWAFVRAAQPFPQERRDAAIAAFEQRGLAAEGKGPSYLAVMIRDGAQPTTPKPPPAPFDPGGRRGPTKAEQAARLAEEARVAEIVARERKANGGKPKALIAGGFTKAGE